MDQKIINRLPALKDIVSVYAVVSFIIQMWAIHLLLGQLSAWSNYLYVSEILSVIAYRIAESFVECLLVLVLLLLFSFILPARFLRDVFVTRGSVIAICFLSSIILFWKRFESDPGVLMANYFQLWTGITIVVAIFFSHFSAKVEAISDFLNWVSERMTIFLYPLIPISLVCVLTVFLRNI